MSREKLLVPLADLPPGCMRAFTVDDREIVVCNTKDGMFALANICTHAFARLSEGRLRGTRLICPLHGAGFDVRTGRALGAPASVALATYSIKALDDAIEVTVAGTPAGAA